MNTVKQISLFVAITFWAMIIGGFAYSHVVYFPVYLTHLPQSDQLINGEYGIHDDIFWKLIHPIAIAVTITALILNWRSGPTRKFILIAISIYVVAIVATATYFVPELLAFANGNTTTNVTSAEWLQRGLTWEHLSWVRGSFMIIGFIMLLIALAKNNTAKF